MLDAARAAGPQSPIIYIFVSRKSADDLRRLIVDAEAAKQTLDAKGNPATPGEQEARQHMANRLATAETERNRLVGEIVGNAKVFQGGGNEVLRLDVAEKVREAAEASLIRLFPRFKEAGRTSSNKHEQEPTIPSGFSAITTPLKSTRFVSKSLPPSAPEKSAAKSAMNSARAHLAGPRTRLTPR
jgi:hypothetical protein